ncbi:MAG: DUF494 domain-containing protein [Ignavibacteria bacterium]|nr:DUF494 domain-containing protein [Ignavibacteria bacterium]
MIHPKIIDLIVYFITELKTSKGISDEILIPLAESGYSQNDINIALEWVFTHATDKNTKGNNTFSSKRFLSKNEERVISPEAFGLLMRLHELGILTHADVNLILDTIMLSEAPQKVELDDLKLIVSAFLMKGRRLHSNFTELMIIN